MFPVHNSAGASQVKNIISENKAANYQIQYNTDVIQRKSWGYICSDLPDELIVTTDKRVVEERNRFKSQPKSRSATTLGMKVCKMTTDPVLCSESRLSLSESRTLSGGSLLVTWPPGKSLVCGDWAEKQQHHQSWAESFPLVHDNSRDTEQMPVPIRSRSIQQITLKSSFYWRGSIYILFF